MRKFLVIVIAMITLVLTACDNSSIGTEQSEMNCTTESETTSENVSSQNSEYVSTEDAFSVYADKDIAKVYREVLKSERTFISVDEGNKEVLLKDYNYYQGTNVETLLKTSFYLTDIDNDINYEIAVYITTEEDYPDKNALFLVYEDGVVYGYNLPEWMYMLWGNAIGWSNVGTNQMDDPDYWGYATIAIDNHTLKFTYVFVEPGSEEEKWVLDYFITDNDSIIYVGDEYDKYEGAISGAWSSRELYDSNIEKYVR